MTPFHSNPIRVLFAEDLELDCELMLAVLPRGNLVLKRFHLAAVAPATGLAFFAVQHHVEIEIAGNDNGNCIGGLDASKRQPSVVVAPERAPIRHSTLHSTPYLSNKLRVGIRIVSSVFFVICASRATLEFEPLLSTAHL